jgi:hypothetical protein
LLGQRNKSGNDALDTMEIREMYLNNICKSYNFKTSVNKTKTMAFKGKCPVRTKIIIQDKTLEKVSHFKYPGYDVIFLEKADIDAKIKKFQIYVALLGGHL